MGKVGWSDLPEELVDVIANHSSSNIDLLRIRSICKPWRSAVAPKKRYLNRFKRSLVRKSDLLPNTFFRVTQASSSCPNKGWLIKTRQVSESSKINLLSPLSSELITPYDKTLDLSKFGVSEIRQSYNVQFLHKRTEIYRDLSRVALVDNHVFLVDYTDKQILYCKRGEERSIWRRYVEGFSDVIVHRGQVYALDLKGAIWRISLYDLSISQYRPSTPVEYMYYKKRQEIINLVEYYQVNNCKDKRLVEYCGDLCVVHSLYGKFPLKRKIVERTIGFKVYKMDKELAEWVEVSCLEDKALIVASDGCFTVLASEYHGCLENAIYFSDDEDGYNRRGVKGEGVKVFKLDDWSIINMIDSYSKSCFKIFNLPFL
ncbi:unnamed protein product [Arabis nemorensis]|uniref:F-box domain-containing protein n=1 Tax=Arabis nemorensis TaxID=586526 RepID=A0A565C932_9BRAS|nr:unnamed protein product [Arabis nemorensis]